VLDLETGDAPAEAVAARSRILEGTGNVKDEAKIAARRQEAAAKISERAALLDASPILCVALQADQSRRIVLNAWTIPPR